MPASRKIYTGKGRRDFVTLLDWMNHVPPWKVRAAAAVGDPHTGDCKQIPVKELMRLSGIPRRTLIDLSYRTSWAGVKLDVISRFAYACGVNLLAPSPLAEYMRRRYRKGLPYLHKKQRAAMDRAARAMKCNPNAP